MSSQDLIHSINNELTVVIGRAELLSQTSLDDASQRACSDIRKAAGNLNRLLREYIHHSLPNSTS